MKERGIIFNGENVNAILEDRKTQTRRPIKNKDFLSWVEVGFTDEFIKDPDNNWQNCSPFGKIGDRLYVRETFTYDNKDYIKTYKEEPWRGEPDRINADCYYKASEKDPDIFPKWTPSIHMPKWAARIWLEIIDIRVERVTQINNDGAMKEGIKIQQSIPRVAKFAQLWNSIYGNWEFGPWVWVIEFKRIEI